MYKNNMEEEIMKYMKPEIEIIDFVAETITNDEPGTEGGYVSGEDDGGV